MPQAIGAVTGAIGYFLVNLGASYAVAAAVSTAFVYAAGAYLLNRAIQALTPKPPGVQSRGVEWQANYAGTNEPRRIIYGEVRVGGMHTIPAFVSGDDGENLHIVLSVAGHEVNDITNVWFDDLSIGDANISAVTGTDADGKVTAGRVKDKAWLRRYLGTSTQTVDYILSQAFPTAFTSAFRGRGIAYLAARLRYGQAAYPSGVPTITMLVQGKKVYDPRDATTVYKTNPALHVRDFLVEEVGFDETQIDDDLVEAAANICDETVDVPGGTQTRYTCNILLMASEAWEDNLKLLVDTMAGRVIYRDGKWRIYAGAWDVPTITLNHSAWASAVTVQASAPRDERWNEVRAWIVDSERQYQRVEAFPRSEAAWVTADGERLFLELDLPGINTDYAGQRLAEIALRQGRNQLKISGRLKPQYMSLCPQDTLSLTDDEFGWALKTFRVVAMDITPLGEVDVVMVEEGEATWTDLEEAEYDAPGTGTPPDPGGGPGGPMIVDPFLNEEFAWWQRRAASHLLTVVSWDTTSYLTWTQGGEVSTYDGRFVVTRANTFDFTSPSSGEPVIEIHATRTPAFKMIPGPDVTAWVRYRRTSSAWTLINSTQQKAEELQFLTLYWNNFDNVPNTPHNFNALFLTNKHNQTIYGAPVFGLKWKNFADAPLNEWQTAEFNRAFPVDDWPVMKRYHTLTAWIRNVYCGSGNTFEITAIDARVGPIASVLAQADVFATSFAGQAGKALIVNNSETGFNLASVGAGSGGGSGLLTLITAQSASYVAMVGSDTVNSPAYPGMQFDIDTPGIYALDASFEIQCNSGGTTLSWNTDATSGAFDGLIRTYWSRSSIPSSSELTQASGITNLSFSRRTTFLSWYATQVGKFWVYTPTFIRLAIFNSTSWGAGGNNGNINRTSWARLMRISDPGTYTV